MLDNNTRFIKTFFLKRKDKLYDKTKVVLSIIERVNKKVKTIQCDNSGQNRKLWGTLDSEGFNIKFEFTASYTPHQNRIVERAFTNLYRIVPLMLNGTGLKKNIGRIPMGRMRINSNYFAKFYYEE